MREAEARAAEAEAKAKEAEEEAREAQQASEGIPLWYGWGPGPVALAGGADRPAAEPSLGRAHRPQPLPR